MASEAKGIIYVPVWVDDGVVKALVLDSGALPVTESDPLTAIQAQAYGYIGSAWQKQGMIWSYADSYIDRQIAANVAAGDVYLSFTIVPEGEVWVITSFTTYSEQGNTTLLYMSFFTATTDYLIKVVNAPEAYVTYSMDGVLILKEGDRLRVRYEDASVGDDFAAFAVGYKMKLDM